MSYRGAALLAIIATTAPVERLSAQFPPFPSAQEDEPRNCELIENEFVYIQALSNGTSNSYVSGPLEVRCEDGVRIQADSAVIFEASGYSQLFGRVMFEDAVKQLTADRATYFSRDRRLVALGNGRIVDKMRSSVITGDTVVYARANQYRPQDILNVTGNSPHATLFPPEPEPPAPELPPEAGAEETTDSTSADVVEGADSVRVPPEPGEPPRRPPARAGPARAGETDTGPDSIGVAPGRAARRRAEAAAEGAEGADTTGVEEGAPEPEVAAQPEADAEIADTEVAEAVRPAEHDTVPEFAPPVRKKRDLRYEVDAVRFSIIGDRLFTAVGEVVIRRDSLEAYGDSLRYDQDEGDIVLMGSARIDEDAFELTGDSIMFGDDGTPTQEIRAVGRGTLVGQDVDLTAPEIRIYLTDSLLDRLMAVREPPDTTSAAEAVAEVAAESPDSTSLEAPHRPRAIAQDFVLVGDSIEVIAPGEVLEQVVAMGNARGESVSRDSLNTPETPEVARRDWLEGNQITVYFSPEVPPELATGRVPVRLERLVAQGSARSLYRMTPSDTTLDMGPGRLALHYVTGSEITIHLVDGEVESMDITGQARGYHLEPLLEPTLTPSLGPDTTVADSLAAPVGDTLGAPALADTAQVESDGGAGEPADSMRTAAEGDRRRTTTPSGGRPFAARAASSRAHSFTGWQTSAPLRRPDRVPRPVERRTS
jgi:lipopolysaccharide export system protein LptA